MPPKWRPAVRAAIGLVLGCSSPRDQALPVSLPEPPADAAPPSVDAAGPPVTPTMPADAALVADAVASPQRLDAASVPPPGLYPPDAARAIDAPPVASDAGGSSVNPCPVASCASGCVDTAADPQNCGACDRVCAGACSKGACACPTPNPQNLVRNGGFDGDVGGWNFEMPLQSGHATADGSGCAGSGSATFTYPRPKNGFQADITQCLAQVMPGVRYRFGAWFQVRGTLPNLGDLQVAIQWHTLPGCGFASGVTPEAEFAHGSFVEALDSWLLVAGESVAPAGTRSAQLRLIINPGESASPLQGSVDMAFLTPAPGRW
jgi:hypothetical protein